MPILLNKLLFSHNRHRIYFEYITVSENFQNFIFCMYSEFENICKHIKSENLVKCLIEALHKNLQYLN